MFLAGSRNIGPREPVCTPFLRGSVVCGFLELTVLAKGTPEKVVLYVLFQMNSNNMEFYLENLQL